ncbi:MAG: hypothetical protein MPN21_05640 [Thermoanaerobaculia bacterium]|nr:hypothetical protein [Thermoanaerobaculia bacterium]
MRSNEGFGIVLRWPMMAVLAALALTQPAVATDYHVTVLTDDLENNGNCTLREAMTASVTNVSVDACPAGEESDVIMLDTVGTYVFSVLGEFTTDSTESLVLKGPTAGARAATINLGFQSRFLVFTGSGYVRLEDLNIAFGVSTGGGGALRFTDGDLDLSNVGLLFNQAGSQGGALYWKSDQIGDNRELSIADSEFSGNLVAGHLPEGGGLFAEADGMGHVLISGSIFDGNTSSSTDPSSPVAGGAGATIEARVGAEVEISDSTFINNEGVLQLDAGTVSGSALEVFLEDSALLLLTDNQFLSNTSINASSSSAVDLFTVAQDPAQLVVDRNILAGNEGWQLNVILNPGGTGHVSNSLLLGGEIGARILGGGNLTVSHLTVTENDVGILMNGFPGGTAMINNSIVTLNGLDFNLPSEVVLLSNLVGVEPEFSDPADGDYRLREGSPAVDMGNSALPGGGRLDLDKGPRVVGPQTDIGAYEFAAVVFADDFELGDTQAWSQTVP